MPKLTPATRPTTTIAVAFAVAAILVIGYVVSPFNKPRHLVISSDVHVSNPEGRWPDATQRYRSLVESLDRRPDIFFVVGDFLDNARRVNGNVSAGDRVYWRAELALYESVNEQLTGTRFLHTYGSGHDFIGDVTLEFAAQHSGIPRRGTQAWGDVDLVWLTVMSGVFNNEDDNPAAFEQAAYDWLDETLAGTLNAILLWHVPIRTPVTQPLGEWPGDTNLTIPRTDRIYDLIDKHQDKILAIFNGHIHKAIRTSYNGIPVFLCPAFRTGCHCNVRQHDGSITVRPKNCDMGGATIGLNE